MQLWQIYSNLKVCQTKCKYKFLHSLDKWYMRVQEYTNLKYLFRHFLKSNNNLTQFFLEIMIFR